MYECWCWCWCLEEKEKKTISLVGNKLKAVEAQRKREMEMARRFLRSVYYLLPVILALSRHSGQGKKKKTGFHVASSTGQATA